MQKRIIILKKIQQHGMRVVPKPIGRIEIQTNPFFAVFNFGISHESQIWNQGEKPLLVDPLLLTVPPVFPDTPEIRKDLAVNYSNLIRLDQQIGKIIEQLKAEGLYKNSVLFFYGDHGGPFPRYKRALYETGIKVPLIIKFPDQKNASTRN